MSAPLGLKNFINPKADLAYVSLATIAISLSSYTSLTEINSTGDALNTRALQWIDLHKSIFVSILSAVAYFTLQDANALWRSFKEKKATLNDGISFALTICPVLAGWLLIVGSLGLVFVTPSKISSFLNIASPLSQPEKSAAWIAYEMTIVLMISLLSYIGHRIMHTERLWNLHRFHHTARVFTIFTKFRTNPFEIAPVLLLSGFSVLAACLNSEVAQKYAAWRLFHEIILHAPCEVKFGKLISSFLVTPGAHRVHHEVALGVRGTRNFSNDFVLWDKIFGTYEAPANDIQIGVSEDRAMGFERGYIYQILQDCRSQITRAFKIFY